MSQSKVSGLWIDGNWVRGTRSMEVRHKYHDRVLGEFDIPSHSQIDLAIRSAAQAARTMRLMPLHRRARILSSVSEKLLNRKEEFALRIAQEAGKPLKHALVEVDRAATTFQWAAEESKRIHGETIPFDAVESGVGFQGWWSRRPIGVVGAITPFNFPLNLVAHKVAPAIASGNAVILKPAELTPLTAIALMELLLEAGMPGPAIQLLQGPGEEVASPMVRDARVGKISFTGSAAVGKILLETAGIKKVTLELGNNSPVLVDKDADLDWAADRCALGAFAYAGQVCISIQRLFIHPECWDEFVPKLIDASSRLQVGDPESLGTDVGPMISVDAAKRAEMWGEEAVREGARILLGGSAHHAMLPPTLIEATPAHCRLMQEEVFAPMANVIRVKTWEEAIHRANETPYGLQASVFGKDIERIHDAIRELDFGGVIVNDIPGIRMDHMPYGGNKQSGIGREGVRFAIEEMTQIQTVAMRLRGSSHES
ncbi:MAG: aldehyde dehydrogenase family protein [Pirellulales bacterium]